MNNNIETYRKIIDIRRALKGIQQLSYDISMTDKRYPLDSLSEDELSQVLEVFKDLKYRLAGLMMLAADEEAF